MPETFSVDSIVLPEDCGGANPTAEALRFIARGMGYCGRFIVDVFLCPACVLRLHLDASQAYATCAEEDEVPCDNCRTCDASRAFTARNQI